MPAKKTWLRAAVLLAVAAVCLVGLLRAFQRPGSPPASGRIPDVAYLFGFDFTNAAGEVVVTFDKEGAQSFHRLTLADRKLRLDWVASGRAWNLAESPLPELPGPARIRILRRRDRAVVALDNKHLLSVSGLELGSEAIPTIDHRGEAMIAATYFQPFEEFYFADDFMRDVPSGEWRALSGAWEVSSTSFVEHSSNPFSLYARGPRSPKTEELNKGRKGQSFVGVGMQVSPSVPHPTVIRVTGNSPAAEAGIRVGDRILEVDGQSTQRQKGERRPQFLQRVIGMLKGEDGTETEMKIQGSPKETPRLCRLKRRRVVWGEIDRKVPIKPYRVEDTALITAGPAFWDQFHFECAVKPRVEGAVGLAFHVRNPENYWLLRWWGDDPDGLHGLRLEIVRIRDGVETVLATAVPSGGPVPFQFYRIGVEVGADHVIGKIDGREMVRAQTNELTFGSAGLYTRGSDGAYFDDVVVSSDAADLADRRKPKLPSGIKDDPVMSAWAELGDPWIPQLTTGIRWHEREFPGDVEIALNRMPDKPARLVIAGNGTHPNRGYILLIDSLKKQVELFRNDRSVATAPLRGAEVLPLVFRREGNELQASEGATQLIRWSDDSPLTRKQLGVQLIDTSIVEVSPNPLVDYTFTSAPVDWEVSGGHWGMMNRWICDPRWSWFGGHSRSILSVWNKRSFEGDVSLEAYVALMMIRPRPPLERPGDVGLTISGDGRSVFSGYTLLVGGEDNQWTRLYRKGQKVAGTSETLFLLPYNYRDRASLDAIHRQWIHLRLARRGARITAYFQGQKALQFTDPEPLPPGRVGVWSVNNGILMGRARIFRERAAGYHVPLRTYARFDDARLTNWVDGEISSEIEEVAPGTYRVRNLFSGGPFAVALKIGESASEFPTALAFECRFEPGVKVDFHVLAEPKTMERNPRLRARIIPAHKYALTGPPDLTAVLQTAHKAQIVASLGKAPSDLTDGGWHPVRIALDKIAIQGDAAPRIVIGNYSNADYLLAGLSGNKPGATYYLRNVKFEAAAGP